MKKNRDGHPRYRHWTIEKVAIAPVIDAEQERSIEELGYRSQDLVELTAGL